MKPGVYYNISNADYHSGEGVSKSFLDIVGRSPLHAKAVMDRANDNPKKETKAKRKGTALHALVLEPHLFADEYVCELTQADAPHAIADRETLVAMVEKLNATRLAKLPVTGAKSELIDRIIQAEDEAGNPISVERDLNSWKAADLKLLLERLNADRPGKFPTSGSMADLRDILNANGHTITLWSDIRARWDAENEGMEVLTVAQYNDLLGMAASIKAHPIAGALLCGTQGGEGVAEASVYVTDPATSELRRVRPDFWRKDGIIVDLKTARDASPEGFSKALAEYGYHRQEPYYMETLQMAYDEGFFSEGWQRPHAFIFVSVEPTAPYAVAAYILDDDSRALGRAQNEKNMTTLAECRRTGKWPGYGNFLQSIGVPTWYLMRNAQLVGVA